jgi:hypothetical protein
MYSSTASDGLLMNFFGFIVVSCLLWFEVLGSGVERNTMKAINLLTNLF